MNHNGDFLPSQPAPPNDVGSQQSASYIIFGVLNFICPGLGNMLSWRVWIGAVQFLGAFLIPFLIMIYCDTFGDAGKHLTETEAGFLCYGIMAAFWVWSIVDGVHLLTRSVTTHANHIKL
jgi:hypothetical protein